MTTLTRIPSPSGVGTRLEWPSGPEPGSYRVKVTCPHCGGLTRALNVGQVVCRSEASVIARCVECSRQWHLSVVLRTLSGEHSGRKVMVGA